MYFDFGDNFIGKFCVIANDKGLRIIAMLKLRKSINCDPAWIGGGIGDYGNVGRASDHVNANRAVKYFFSVGDESISRSNNFINGFN